jgi:cellulose synthase/poly-beta-1,6-N-acetylglucosamine synthase-like glycosyltransferase
VTILIALILAPLTLLTLCFAVELLCGLRALRAQPAPAAGAIAATIIVPAHNEEAVIGENLALLKEHSSGAAILVVADNCTDSTAELARRAGADVVERFDADRRGKGFALDFAKRTLASAPPDVAIIMDADCVPDPHGIERLIGACAATGRPCQAIYLQKPALGGSPVVQLSTFAFFIKNVVRQRALQRTAGRVHLLGTGMAFPWPLFDKAELATGNIVEDLELGLDLADGGHPAILVEDAAVWTDPAAETNTMEQRRRWEGGYLQGAMRWGPSLLLQGIRRGDARRLWTGLSLFIPPIALLVTLDLAAIAAAGLVYLISGAGLMPLILLCAALVLAAAAILAAWGAGGSRFIPLSRLAQVPLYLAWKLPLYLGLARRGAPGEWVRTHRG